MSTLAELAGWWVVLVVGDLVLISTVDRNELLVAAGAAAAGAVAAVVGRRATRCRYPLSASDLRPLLRIPAAVLPETVRLVRVLASRRRPIGAWVRKQPPAKALADGDEGTVLAAAWTVGQSATPGSIVAELEPGSAVTHTLQPAEPA